MTQITVKQLAAAKRIAANVLPLTNKKAKLNEKIAAMEREIEGLNKQIDEQQGYVKGFAAGLTTESLLVRAENKFLPNPDVLTFDEDKRVYVIKETVSNDSDAAAEAEQAVIESKELTPDEQAALDAANAEAATAEENNQQPVAEPATTEENDPFAA